MAKPIKLKRKLITFVLVTLLLLTVTGSIALALIWHSETLDTARLTTMAQTATFYDSEQNTIDAHNNIKYCPIDQISPDCVNAFVAVEDKTFYKHHGLSIPRIAKAFVNNLAAVFTFI